MAFGIVIVYKIQSKYYWILWWKIFFRIITSKFWWISQRFQHSRLKTSFKRFIFERIFKNPDMSKIAILSSNIFILGFNTTKLFHCRSILTKIKINHQIFHQQKLIFSSILQFQTNWKLHHQNCLHENSNLQNHRIFIVVQIFS